MKTSTKIGVAVLGCGWMGRKDSGDSMMGEKLSHDLDLPRWWTGDEVKEVYGASGPNVVPCIEVHDNDHEGKTWIPEDDHS